MIRQRSIRFYILLFLSIYSLIFLFGKFNQKNWFNEEKDPFEKGIQRLLNTHSLAYNNDQTVCQSNGELNEKDEELLIKVEELLPQLKEKIIPYPHEYYQGRGIVLTVGPNQLLHTRFNLRILQWSETKLNIEVWYSSFQISRDLIDDLLRSVPQLNISGCSFEANQCYSSNGQIRNLSQTNIYPPQTKNINGKIYTFKLAAIISSTFSQLIFLDSDCYVVRDPSPLFQNDPMYNKFGVLFYPDIYTTHQHSRLWSLLNTTCFNEEFSVDSGVLLFDKKRVWNALFLTKLMSDHHTIFYQHFLSNGDKDTFRLAFRYMKIPYYIVGIPCSNGYVINHTFCGVTLCKTDSLGLNIYFDHVHHPKHLNDLTFNKINFTHTQIALADPNTERFITGYCGLYPLPCFQVGIYNRTFPISHDTHCRTSAFIHSNRSLIQTSEGQTILWNPNVDTQLLLLKTSNQTMPGYIDFYFQTQNETIFRNTKL